jgi:hypothetical protein
MVILIKKIVIKLLNFMNDFPSLNVIKKDEGYGGEKFDEYY